MNNLLNFIIALTCFMSANIITGVIKANKLNDFSWVQLRDGILKYVLWLISFILGFIAIQFFPNIQISLGEEIITLAQSIEVIEITIISVYAVKFIQNCFEYHNIKKEVKPIEYRGGERV